MNSPIFEKNAQFWSTKKIVHDLKNFISIYENRPIKNNKGGMLFSHMFYFYNILNNLKPDLVVESGIYKGQSTWLIETVLPNSKIVSIDINLKQREYISEKAFYSSDDFKFQDFKDIPENSLVFFDDHVNHVDRINDANFFGFKNIILEDNYIGSKSDFQTIKQIYNNYFFNHNPGFLSLIKTFFLFSEISLKKIVSKKYNAKKDLDIISKRIRDGYSKNTTFENIDKLIETYFEFPPLYQYNHDFDKTLIKEPIFEKIPDNIIKYIHQSNDFNFFTFIKLK
tara:strand:- start:1376 stop:2221 length:846 start_codon:yes stop_codon:yes gene_type:complete